mmetsp:Transcript_139505/g.242662  ORF Transcript_139505/g.242662 Transcript_139505/m.242662 type:complete len:266 (+) Transcript_139505:375-1172(+)
MAWPLSMPPPKAPLTVLSQLHVPLRWPLMLRAGMPQHRNPTNRQQRGPTKRQRWNPTQSAQEGRHMGPRAMAVHKSCCQTHLYHDLTAAARRISLRMAGLQPSGAQLRWTLFLHHSLRTLLCSQGWLPAPHPRDPPRPIPRPVHLPTRPNCQAGPSPRAPKIWRCPVSGRPCHGPCRRGSPPAWTCSQLRLSPALLVMSSRTCRPSWSPLQPTARTATRSLKQMLRAGIAPPPRMVRMTRRTGPQVRVRCNAVWKGESQRTPWLN